MKLQVQKLSVLFVIAAAILPFSAHAVGVCDLLTGLSLNGSLPGGRNLYGSGYQQALQNADDDSTAADGTLSTPIELKDDQGVVHKLSGKITVDQIYMISSPTASYACVELETGDASVDIAFQISNRADIANTAISAASSGRGFGLSLLSYGADHYYTDTPTSCNYTGPSQQVCNTYPDGREYCYDQTVTTNGPCTEGELETNDQGKTVNFGITNSAGKIIGTFQLVQEATAGGIFSLF